VQRRGLRLEFLFSGWDPFLSLVSSPSREICSQVVGNPFFLEIHENPLYGFFFAGDSSRTFGRTR